MRWLHVRGDGAAERQGRPDVSYTPENARYGTPNMITAMTAMITPYAMNVLTTVSQAGWSRPPGSSGVTVVAGSVGRLTVRERETGGRPWRGPAGYGPGESVAGATTWFAAARSASIHSDND